MQRMWQLVFYYGYLESAQEAALRRSAVCVRCARLQLLWQSKDRFVESQAFRAWWQKLRVPLVWARRQG